MDLDRLRLIADQVEEPNSVEETAFLAGYLGGVKGCLLMSLCIEVNTDELARGELDHFIFGYCWGQKDLDEALMGLDKTNLH